MKINLSKKKTEAFVVLRGKHSKRLKQSLVCEDGSLGFPLPTDGNGSATSPQRLVLTDSYKHLGGFVACTGNLALDGRHRASSTMSSFTHIAHTIFGSSVVSFASKMRLAWGLIMSKLFYNVHVWSYFSGAPRRALNVVYMRVWRRIAQIAHVSTGKLGRTWRYGRLSMFLRSTVT